MNILILAGSPKGETSVTMQYVKWLQQNSMTHSFEVVQVAQPIRKLEENSAMLEEVSRKVAAADGVLWAFPLYIAMPHAGVKRFVELVNERGMAGAFRGKHCAILATSIKFFDSTAVEYMRGVSEDLGMQVDEVFSAEMQDLLRPGGTEQLATFFRKWMECIEQGAYRGRRTAPVDYKENPYMPADTSPTKRAIKVGIVTQSGVSGNLDRMVERVAECFVEVEIHDLATMHIAGNCTGCLRCGYSNICLYEGRDEVIEAYRSLQRCDAILFCGFVVDRYLSARWKTFIDRMFWNTHMPTYANKPMGMVIAGPLRQISNLRGIMEGVYGTMQVRWAGFATDESADTDRELAGLADNLLFLAQSGYAAPEQFPAIGGRKVFRDEIFGGLNGVFPADHRYYKKHGWYDFAHKRVGQRLASAAMRAAMRIPSVRKVMQDNMNSNMIMSYKKVLR